MLKLPASGSCQCGACTYTLDSSPFVAYTCHCTECQKLTASAFLTCMQVPSEAVTLSSGSPAARERAADSGNSVKTWFCPSCGTTLFAENSSRPGVRTIHVGSLEHPDAVQVEAHIWVKRKLPWVTLPSNHRVYSEAGDWTRDYAHDPSRYAPEK